MKAITCLFILICQVIPCQADEPKAVTCDETLALCLKLTQDQDESIKQLKAYANDLEDRVAEDEKPKVPEYVWIIGGFLTGSIVTAILIKR